MIVLKNLTKKFDQFTAVDSINMTIQTGEFFGLLGLNGAGKTTTIGMLSTLLLPTQGEIYIDGELLVEDEAYDKIADAGIAASEIRLENDEYFVLGDNRNGSEDSRSGNIGPVNRDTIMGKVWFQLGREGESMGFVK